MVNEEYVELRTAYAWDCPDCGRELFVRAIVPEMGEEELQELKDDFGIQPWEEGEFHLMPQEVKCPHCDKKFKVKLPESLDDEEY